MAGDGAAESPESRGNDDRTTRGEGAGRADRDGPAGGGVGGGADGHAHDGHADGEPDSSAAADGHRPAGAGADRDRPTRSEESTGRVAPTQQRSRTRSVRSGQRRPAQVRVSRSEQLQQTIKDLIVQRGLSAGDPLPTEFDLVDELGVSRNSLREALKGLQAVGIVEIRHGFGMYVGRMSLGALVDELAFHSRITMQHDHRDLANVIYLREVLESGLVLRLIEEQAGADHSEVAAVVEQMDAEARDGFVAPETDRQFHAVLYRPLGNPLVPQLLGAFWDVYFQLKDGLGPMTEAAESVARRHRDVYLAVIAGDGDAAQSAMTAHFDGVRGRLDALVHGR